MGLIMFQCFQMYSYYIIFKGLLQHAKACFKKTLRREREICTSSMQNKEAALIKVAGTTIQLQSSQSMMGRVRCHKTRNLEVKRV